MKPRPAVISAAIRAAFRSTVVLVDLNVECRAYNHRFSSRFVVCMSATIKREVIGGRVRYIFGGTDPLTATEVADLLAIECEHCYRTFKAFRALVAEQLAAIVAVEGGSKSVSGGQQAR